MSFVAFAHTPPPSACPCLHSLRRSRAQAALLDEEKLDGVTVLLFANKQDLITAMPPEELMSALKLTSQRGRKIIMQPCSAKTGDGLQEGLKQLLDVINAAKAAKK